MYDIISLGDSTIDTIVGISDATVACSIDKDNCMLQLRYADKLPVETITQKVAGNSANNAVGMARLGFKTLFHTILGDDSSGDTIIKEMKKQGVDVKFIEQKKKRSTNASTVINYKGERTILVYHAPRTYRLPKLPKAKWVYYSSLGKDHKRYNTQVIKYVKKHKVKMGYNPGTYQFLEGLSEVKRVLAATHVVFVNVDEASRIVKKKKTILSYAKALHKLGPKIVVITDGPNGAHAYDGVTLFSTGIFEQIKVIERTGAGDAFAVGFVSALMDGKDIPEAMQRGHYESCGVISHIGPQDGLLNRKQMSQYKRRLGELKVTKV